MSLLRHVIGCLPAPGKKHVSLGELVDCAGHDRRQVLRVMDKLAREGYLEEINDNQEQPGPGEYGPPRRNPTWRVVRDPAKRPVKNRPRGQSLRSKLWRLIRAKHRFTKADLVVCSGACAATTDDYVRDLERAGYVRRTGKDGGSVTYMCTRPNQVEPPRGLFGGGS